MAERTPAKPRSLVETDLPLPPVRLPASTAGSHSPNWAAAASSFRSGTAGPAPAPAPVPAPAPAAAAVAAAAAATTTSSPPARYCTLIRQKLLCFLFFSFSLSFPLPSSLPNDSHHHRSLRIPLCPSTSPASQ